MILFEATYFLRNHYNRKKMWQFIHLWWLDLKKNENVLMSSLTNFLYLSEHFIALTLPTMQQSLIAFQQNYLSNNAAKNRNISIYLTLTLRTSDQLEPRYHGNCMHSQSQDTWRMLSWVFQSQ